jgi:hypothetical protein
MITLDPAVWSIFLYTLLRGAKHTWSKVESHSFSYCASQARGRLKGSLFIKSRRKIRKLSRTRQQSS